VTGRGRGDAASAAEPVVALFQEALCGMLGRRYVRRGYQPLGRYLLIPSSVPDAHDATRRVCSVWFPVPMHMVTKLAIISERLRSLAGS